MCQACGERKATSTGVCRVCNVAMASGIIPDTRVYVPPPCVSCGVRGAQRRGVCTACERAIGDGLMPDVRTPRRRAPPGHRRWSGADFAAVFFSPEAVQRRIAHTRARERARSSR